MGLYFSNGTGDALFVTYAYHSPGCEGGTDWSKKGWHRIAPTQALAGTPTKLGNGVAAAADGADAWGSQSGYRRPRVTNFEKSSLWGSSSAATLARNSRRT